MAGKCALLFRSAARETVAEAQTALVALAKAKHSEVMADEPKPQRFTRRVDGVLGAREEAVRADGMIVYTYHRLEEVVRVAMDTLFQLSPVLSGEYRMRHTIFVDGVASPNLKAWDGKGELMIANVLPYSRKIEVGKMKMKVPGSERVYQQAEEILATRFGNTVSVFFTYRGIASGSAIKGKGSNKHSLRYPALIFRER